MSMSRVQFQPGLSMPEFIQLYGAEAQCEAALIQVAGLVDFAVLGAAIAVIACYPAEPVKPSNATLVISYLR